MRAAALTACVLLAAPPAARALTLTKYGAAPVIGPSWIPGSQDYCGARDMGMALGADGVLSLVYSGYNACNGSQPTCGPTGCCQLMFSTLPPPPRDGSRGPNATRLGTVLPPPGPGYFNLTTDAGLLFDAASDTWHMWVTEMPTGFEGSHRQIGHLTAPGAAGVPGAAAWTYESTAVFDPLPAWSPYAVDEPRVYPATAGGWIMYLGSQGNNNCGSGSVTPCDAWCIGYATASALNGPWRPSDGCIIGSGNSTLYQAEAFSAFTAGGVFYVLTNRLGTQGYRGADWLKNIVGDLWAAPSQTGPFTLAQASFLPRGDPGAWDAGYAYVTALAGGYDLDAAEVLYGAYMGGSGGLPGAGPISVGLFTLAL